MKKIFFLAAAASIALVACNKTEQGSVASNAVDNGINNNEISVMNVSRSTKGYVESTAFEDTPYDELHAASPTKSDRTMLMSAYYVPQTGLAANYFVGEEFSKNAGSATDGLWHHDPKIYWPVAAQSVDFLALSSTTPFSGTAIKWDSDNAASQCVLDVSEAYKQDDILYGAVAGRQTNAGASVAMTFNHTQAWIQFQLKVNSAEMANIITINSITFKNIYSRGELTLNGGASPSASWNFNKETAGDVLMDDVLGVTGTGTFLSENVGYMDMLIPAQAQTKFIINYTLAGQSTPLEYEYTLSSAQWLAGKRYIYAINFSLYEITVTPQVTAFEDADVSGDGFPKDLE